MAGFTTSAFFTGAVVKAARFALIDFYPKITMPLELGGAGGEYLYPYFCSAAHRVWAEKCYMPATLLLLQGRSVR